MRKSPGWKNESYRHSLAARGIPTKIMDPERHSLARKGIKTRPNNVNRKFESVPMEEMRFYHFTPLEYIYFGEQSAPYQSDDPVEDFHRDMLEYGYDEPFDYYWGHGPELIVKSSEMYLDPRVSSYFKKRAITETQNSVRRRKK